MALIDTPSAAAARTLAQSLDKGRGLPARGVHVGLGPHCDMPETWDGEGAVPVGWTSHVAGIDGATLQVLDYDVVDVTDAGAVGDDETDCYAALQAVAAAVAETVHKIVLFPPGDYFIDQYRITGENAQELEPNDVADIVWSDMTDVHIVGYGATVRCKGDFLRSADYVMGSHMYSRIRGVTPFSLLSCPGCSVHGIAVNGGCDETMRDSGVVEGASHGIVTRGCSDYTIADCTFRLCAADGVLLGASTDYDTNARLVRVTCADNARNALSVIQVVGGLASSCTFQDSGRTLGDYGGHNPRAGVDIEPDRPTAIDTQDWLFEDCKFLDNVGSQFVSAVGTKAHDIVIRRATMRAAEDSTHYVVILAVDGATIEDSDIDTGAGAICPCWGGVEDTSTTLDDVRIATTGRGLLVAMADMAESGVSVLIDDCELTSHAIDNYAPYLQGNGVTFTNNTTTTGKERYSDQTSGITVALVQHCAAAGNHWTTDLVPGQDGIPEGAYFSVSYTGATVDADMLDAGVHPNLVASWDPKVPYSQ